MLINTSRANKGGITAGIVVKWTPSLHSGSSLELILHHWPWSLTASFPDQASTLADFLLLNAKNSLTALHLHQFLSLVSKSLREADMWHEGFIYMQCQWGYAYLPHPLGYPKETYSEMNKDLLPCLDSEWCQLISLQVSDITDRTGGHIHTPNIWVMPTVYHLITSRSEYSKPLYDV